jgi:hypothetical protein
LITKFLSVEGMKKSKLEKIEKVNRK